MLDFVLGSEPLELGFVADFEGLEGSFWLAGLDVAGLLNSFWLASFPGGVCVGPTVAKGPLLKLMPGMSVTTSWFGAALSPCRDGQEQNCKIKYFLY